MAGCNKCGHHSSRRRRNLVLKIFSRASFHCDHCGANSNFHRSFLAIFQRWCQCPLCHNRQLKVRSKMDKVDRVSPNAFRHLLRLFGFPIYYCTFCRYQFRDWRKLDPHRERPAGKAAGGS